MIQSAMCLAVEVLYNCQLGSTPFLRRMGGK